MIYLAHSIAFDLEARYAPWGLSPPPLGIFSGYATSRTTTTIDFEQGSDKIWATGVDIDEETTSTIAMDEEESSKINLEMKINCAFEHEFTFIDKKDLNVEPSFSLRSQRKQNEFASWLMSSLKVANVQPEMFLSEFGQNQYEITCHPTDPLTGDIARQMDLNLTFSPLASINSISNGVHLHISIQDLQGKYLFYDSKRPFNLSIIGEYFSAGILHHLNSLCAITAPTPVSYLRLKPHH